MVEAPSAASGYALEPRLTWTRLVETSSAVRSTVTQTETAEWVVPFGRASLVWSRSDMDNRVEVDCHMDDEADREAPCCQWTSHEVDRSWRWEPRGGAAPLELGAWRDDEVLRPRPAECD